MCRNDAESLNHLLLHCPIALSVFEKVVLGGYEGGRSEEAGILWRIQSWASLRA